ncbi:MAG TPA: hypothetical protein DDX39_07140 [Bacteroidales bacterium]|nr:hypothetical protein [Bacteroidales bacterium]
MKYIYIAILFLTIASCNSTDENADKSNQNKLQSNFLLSQDSVNQITKDLMSRFDVSQSERIERCVKQTASIWRASDGTVEDFKIFCTENFVDDEVKLSQLFEKLSRNFEILNGNFNKISVDLKLPLHIDYGEITTVDMMFGSYEPSAHLHEDLYLNKVAFLVALNFPMYSLKEKNDLGMSWTSQQWAYARMGDMFVSREPSELAQKYAEVSTAADAYISDYNIYMGNLINDKNETLFPAEMKLITHWGLRDELKSNYNAENGFEKQNMIYAVMKNIISQEIPENVINNSEYKWNPTTNQLFDKTNKEVKFKPEANVRYQHLLNSFHALKAEDEYNEMYPNYPARKFDVEMEISQAEVEKLFIDFVSSPVVKDVAEIIKKRLGRDLQPFDIWYDGFKARSSINEEDLDKITTTKYPSKIEFENDLPNILQKLGFDEGSARFISSKITVDASRGAGHAWGAEMKSDNARLRTRVAENGMNYKGYNIAIHEFGHNVEQTISLHDVDYYMLRGVPNTAFTEALAFVFQAKDLELLGIKETNTDKKYLEVLDNFWGAYEIMGVSLVDMNVWKWLYENPEASPEDLKNAVNKIAKDVWNEYYEPIFGMDDEPILAVYSHMIDAPLYLSAYPIGQLIQFQLEQHFDKGDFAPEVMRMFKNGRLTPQVWMKKAVGAELSAQPMTDAAKVAVEHLK